MIIPLPYNIWGTDSFDVLMRNNILLWIGITVVFCVFYFTTNAKQHTLEPECVRRPVAFHDSDDILRYFGTKLENDDYLHSFAPLQSLEGSIHLYYKELNRKRCDCFTIICAKRNHRH